MASENLTDRLKNSSEFKLLIRKRLRVCMILSIIMVAFYSGFYLCMAFLPEFMGRSLTKTSVISIGVYFGIASMLLATLLAGIYAWWSDSRYEPEKEKILKGLRDEE